MTDEQTQAAVETESNPKKTSAVGGFVGTVLGSRLGRGGALIGGLVGGTLGYLAGATSRSPVDTTDPDPVAIDVADPAPDAEGELETDETEATDEE